MQVTRITNAADLEPWSCSWNRLAGDVPFRRYEWLACWWWHYGAGSELYTLAVHQGRELIGLAPWYLQRSRSHGAVLRFLGSGEVCSDYLGLICAPGREQEVAAVVADWLTHGSRGRPSSLDRWDLLELDTVAADDRVVRLLVDELARRQCDVHTSPGLNCWRLTLPPCWAAYEAMLSKSHRKQMRRLEGRAFDCGRAVLRTAATPDELTRGREILVDLHQRRWQSLGKSGCFATHHFAAFHQEVMQALLAFQSLRLHWLELDGVPVAAEYHLTGGNVIYAYQSGVDPQRLEDEPGRLAGMATLRLAIEQGFQAFDFLRGDEPYKAHWRAAPQPTCNHRIAAGRPTARLRQAAWRARERAKQWVKAHGFKPAATALPIDGAKLQQTSNIDQSPLTTH